MNMKVIKIIGTIASVGGAALSLVANWAGEKQQDAKIMEKVTEAISEISRKES